MFILKENDKTPNKCNMSFPSLFSEKEVCCNIYLFLRGYFKTSFSLIIGIDKRGW